MIHIGNVSECMQLLDQNANAPNEFGAGQLAMRIDVVPEPGVDEQIHDGFAAPRRGTECGFGAGRVAAMMVVEELSGCGQRWRMIADVGRVAGWTGGGGVRIVGVVQGVHFQILGRVGWSSLSRAKKRRHSINEHMDDNCVLSYLLDGLNGRQDASDLHISANIVRQNHLVRIAEQKRAHVVGAQTHVDRVRLLVVHVQRRRRRAMQRMEAVQREMQHIVVEGVQRQ